MNPIGQAGVNSAMLIRFAISHAGALLTTAPLLSHLRPHSMLADPERAIQFSVLLHSALLFALLTSDQRHGRRFEVTAVVIWVVAFWVTFPNF